MAMTAAVKDEIARLPVTRTCCRKSEVSSILRFAGGLHLVSGRIVIEAELDTGIAARRLRFEERTAVRRADIWIASIDSLVVLALATTLLILVVLAFFADENAALVNRGLPIVAVWMTLQFIAVAMAEARPASYDLVLLDVDNGPGYLVHDTNARLYERDFLTATRAALRPGGVLVVWSAAEAPDLRATLAEVFCDAEARPLEVRLQDRDEHYWLYVARVPSQA